MTPQEMKEESRKKKRAKNEQINFTLKLTATDLPLDDKNFKIKLSMDFGPEFNSKLKGKEGDFSPNFNGRRVRALLRFVSDDVIRKVMEFIYFKELYVTDGKPHTLVTDDAINRIYEERRKYRQSNDLSSKPGLKEEEERIAKTVNALIDAEGRDVPIQEKSVANIKFEHLSPGKLAVNVQKIINGDMPPPK